MVINTTKARLLIAEVGTHKEVAEKAGISRSTLTSALSRGSACPRTVLQLAEALGVEPITLVKED